MRSLPFQLSLLFLLVLASTAEVRGKVHISTYGCRTLPLEFAPAVSHVFHLPEIASAAPQSLVLIAHGDLGDGHAGWKREPLWREVLPVYVSRKNALTDIPLSTLVSILNGKVGDWGQVGGSAGPVQVFLHGGVLQRQAAAALFTSRGVDLARLSELRPVYGDTYADLARLASQSAGALVLGLQPVDVTEALKALSVNGVSLETALKGEPGADYPLGMPIYLYSRPTPEAQALRERVLQTLREDPRVEPAPDPAPTPN